MMQTLDHKIYSSISLTKHSLGTPDVMSNAYHSHGTLFIFIDFHMQVTDQLFLKVQEHLFSQYLRKQTSIAD